MAFEKGHTKKGGRVKGSENLTTKETREVLQSILSEELEKLSGYIAAITKPEVKAKLIIDLLPFVLPKLNSVDHNSTGTGIVGPRKIRLNLD